MKRQQKHRYSSLISHIAIILLATHGLIYLLGRLVGFAYEVAYVSYGNVFLVDIIFLIVDCVKFIACLLIPLKLFDYLRSNAFHEKLLPEEHEKAPTGTIIAVFLLGLACNYIFAWINIYSVDMLISMSYLGENEQYVLGSGLEHGYQIVIYIISTAVIPAIVEELVFRKTICKSLLPYGPKTAVLVSAILFGFMHTSFHKIGFTFIGGIFLGWLYVASKDIRVPMLFHFIHNLTSCIGTIIAYKVSMDAYTTFIAAYCSVLFWVGLGALIYLIARRDIKKEILVMLPDENGEEVKPLRNGERVSGFFSPLMIVFLIATVIQMFYYLSFQLV